jgi:CO/xanthine dehydrogenase Mo-binding subunit
MGLGQALMEHLKIEEGQVAVGHFGDYKVPTIQDIPDLTTILLENPAGPTPYQGRGIGELTNVSVIAAIANAVADAVGVRITELPITAEKVLAGIKANSKAK